MADLNHIETLAAHKFEAWTKDALDDLPNNDEITEWALGLGQFLRMCTVLMLDDDEALCAKFKTAKDRDTFLEMMESIAAKLDGLNGFRDVMSGAVGRLSVGCARFEITH